MLLKVDPVTKTAQRLAGVPLRTFGMKERDLQAVLFGSLDRLVGDDELLLIMQSKEGREEPDLMALDRDGNLFIFEIKVWESESANLLQVLRYGQLFGARDCDGLDQIWRRASPDDRTLLAAHRAKFDVELKPAEINRKQIFVVLTNGLDVGTRQAIRYWRSTGLDVRPWVYRAYEIDGSPLLEISPFRQADDPLEDQAESAETGYFVVNTNIRQAEEDDADMLAGKKVAAYFHPWKQNIGRLKRGDQVFLYRSGQGIVAAGRADGNLRKSPYHGEAEHLDEEFSMGLQDFVRVNPPISAAAIKEIIGSPMLIFNRTSISLDPIGGSKLLAAVRDALK